MYTPDALNLLIVSMLTWTLSSCQSNAEGPAAGAVFPDYGPEIAVEIRGLDFDAMEPFLSPDGTTLFFNNLNDGIETRLYFATRLNDTTFQWVGEVEGTGQPEPPHLDAVPDLDKLGNFYWTSTREYPEELDNLFRGDYAGGVVTSIGRVRGNFNKGVPGWLVMDHGIRPDGEYLYYNNARFDPESCTGPCETEIGIASKIDDTTFAVLEDSERLLAEVNDPNYINYAPCIDSDGLELYYSRYRKGPITPDTRFELCVSIRAREDQAFSPPRVLFFAAPPGLVEAPTLSADRQRLYYHRKVDDIHRIFLRYRNP